MRSISLPPNDTGHAAPITHAAFSPDNRSLATCSYDGTVIIWDVSDPAEPLRRTQLRHRRLVNSSTWNPVDPSLLATASADKTVAIWKVDPEGTTPSVHSVLARHTDDINAVAWMPDGQRLICVSEDGRATMWDISDGAFLSEIGSHTAHCMAVAVSGDGRVATVGEDGLVAVHSPDDERETLERYYTSSVEGCSWSHGGEYLAVACDDGTVEVLDDDLKPVDTIAVSTSAARAVSWTDDDLHLVVGAYDGSVHLLDRDSGERRRLTDPRLWPRSVDVSADTVVVGSFSNRAHLFDLRTAEPVSGPDHANHGPNALATSENTIFIGCDSGMVFAIDADNPEVDPTAYDVGGNPILSLATDGEAIYAGTYSGHVVRVDNGTVSHRQSLAAPVPSLSMTGDGVAAGTYNGELFVLDDQLRITSRRVAHDGSIKSLASVNGSVASAATDRTIALGDAESRKVLWQHGNLVNAIAALDGQVVASASRDHTVKVGRLSEVEGRWCVSQVQSLLGADESVKAVGLLGDPDAPFVLAGAYDFGLYVWHVDWNVAGDALTQGTVLAEFSQGVSCIAAVDRDRVVVAGWDGQVLLVGLTEDGAVTILRRWWINDIAQRGVVSVPEVSEAEPDAPSGAGRDGSEVGQ